MREMDLLHILDDLGDEDFKRFKWCLKLKEVGNIEPIKESQLSNAERLKVVDLMVQKYEFAAAVEVIKSILPKMNRKDLVRKLPNISAGAEGLGMDLSNSMDSIEREDTEMPNQRTNSLPLHLLGLSPSLKGQETDSHRDGIFGQQPSQITASSTSQIDNKENMPEEGFELKTPTKQVSQSHVHSSNSGQSKEAFAHRRSSTPAVKSLSRPPFRHRPVSRTSGKRPNHPRDVNTPVRGKRQHSLGVAQMDIRRYFQTTASPLKASQPVIRHPPRNLFRSPSMPSPVSGPSENHPDHPGDENTPVRVRRRHSLGGTHVTTKEQNPESPRMMALASPREFVKINDPEVESVRQEFQLLTYACRDRAVTRQELYKRSIEVNGKAMDLLVRQVLLRRAAEQKLANMQQELCDT